MSPTLSLPLVGPPFGVGGGDGEVGVGAHSKGYVSVLGVVSADLAVIGSDLVLGRLKHSPIAHLVPATRMSS
jgi:hypothetical protein